MNKLHGVGTKQSGYADPRHGPFECGNCIHFHSGSGSSMMDGFGSCDHPEVVADPEVERIGDGAAVQEMGCCNYFQPRKPNIGAAYNARKK